MYSTAIRVGALHCQAMSRCYSMVLHTKFLSLRKSDTRVELMPYYTFGTHKYDELSMHTNELEPTSTEEILVLILLMKNYSLIPINKCNI